MSITLAGILLNCAYCAFAVSGLLKDMLRLRLVWLCSTLLFMAHGFVAPLWPAVYWNIPVMCVHVWMITALLRDQRGINLDAEAEAIHTLLFPALDLVSFSAMWKLSEERHFDGDVLIVKDQPVDELILLLEGEVRVVVGGKRIVRMGHFRILGEMSSLSGTAASATVVCDGPVHARTWNKQALAKWGEAHPVGQVALLQAMGREVSQKLSGRDN